MTRPSGSGTTRPVRGPAAPLRGADRLAEGLTALREAWQVPGVGVTVVRGDEAAVFTDGTRDLSTGAPLTPHTLFPLGSLTKSVIAAQLARLVAQGLTGWDTGHLTTVLPQGAPRDGYTLTQLLTHSSGLPSYDLLLAGCADTSPGEAARGRLPHLVTVRPPGGDRFSYSDLAYVLACHIAEETAGRPWDRLLGDILSELGVRGRRPGPSGDFAHACEPDGTGGLTDTGPVRLSGLSDVISGVWASPADMVALLRFHLFGHGSRQRLLDDRVLAQLRTPRMPAPTLSANHPACVEADGYGYGWLVGRYRGEPALVHSSSVGALRGMTVLLPDRDLAVNVFCNTGVRHSPGRAHCCFRCAVTFSLIDAIDDGHERGREHRLPAGEPERMAGPAPGRVADLPSLEALPGTYHHPGFGFARIEPNASGPGAVFRYGPLTGAVRRAGNGTLFTVCPADPGPIALAPVGTDRLAIRMERSVPAFEFTRAAAR
ncbi:serine hydrolase domain-containing protein [Streptomyces sp. NPDC056411]|uniref:serine hydrolase domain-containing protein n=1 Tax=Streptomyces sp. NPDC056411 TaxID=3345813 RepID=UPI0035D63877